MFKDKVIFKRKSWIRGNYCPFCFKKIILWEVTFNGSSSYCCGNKHCRKQAEKKVS